MLAGTRKRSCRDDGASEANPALPLKSRRKGQGGSTSQSTYKENLSESDSDLQDDDEEDVANKPTKEMLGDWRFHVHGKTIYLYASSHFQS